MSKNLRNSYILYLVFASVIIAWQTIFAYFGGVGVAFAGILVLFSANLTYKIIDKYVSNRTKDLFILNAIFAGFELLIYFFIEFRIGTIGAMQVFYIIQNVISFLAILLLAYTMLRFLTDIKNVKIGFVECLLGNSKGKKKTKKAKEISNGSLEEKPNEKTEQPALVSNDENIEQ